MIESSGFDPSLSHPSILKLYNELEAVKKAAEPKLAVLRGFNELPADLSLAKIKVEETRNKLFQLEEQLTTKINQFI